MTGGSFLQSLAVSLARFLSVFRSWKADVIAEHQKEPRGELGDSLQCWQQHGLTTITVDDLECTDQHEELGPLQVLDP